jgi:predicted PurR-regulated permease PerM
MPKIAPLRRNRLLLIAALVVLVAAMLWSARGALFPYLFALVLAYLMLPAVNWLDRGLLRGFPRFRGTRPVAILLVYLLTIGLVVAFFALVVPVVGQQFKLLWANREQLIGQAQRLAEQMLSWYRTSVPADLQARIAAMLEQLASAAGRTVQTGVMRTVGVVTSTASFVLGMAVVPFWLFYLLHDQAKVGRAALGLIPSRFRSDVVNLLRIADTILGAYLRGQLLLCVFIGVMATVGLTLLGVQFPAVLGLLAGIFEILPFIGPFLGLVPAVLVAVIQAPILGLWTLILFLAIQQVENLFLVPRVSGQAVELHPAIIMVVLVIGNEVAGLWGMLLVVPLTAIVRDVFKYLYLRFQDEPLSPREALARLGRTPLRLT